MSDDTARLLAGLHRVIAKAPMRSSSMFMLSYGISLQRFCTPNVPIIRSADRAGQRSLFANCPAKPKDWRDKWHFFAVAATLMRRILIDHARKRASTKRGGRSRTLVLTEELVLSDQTDPLDLIAFDEVLNNLAQMNDRHARIVELRYFAGLSIEETAEALEVSPATIKNDWRVARAWLSAQLSADLPS